MDGSADPAPLDRRFAAAVMTGNQQNKTVASVNCPIKSRVDRGPGVVERVAVKIDGPVGLHRP